MASSVGWIPNDYCLQEMPRKSWWMRSLLSWVCGRRDYVSCDCHGLICRSLPGIIQCGRVISICTTASSVLIVVFCGLVCCWTGELTMITCQHSIFTKQKDRDSHSCLHSIIAIFVSCYSGHWLAYSSNTVSRYHFPKARGGPRARGQHKKPALLLTTIRNQGRGVRNHPEGWPTPLKSSIETLVQSNWWSNHQNCQSDQLEIKRISIIVKNSFTQQRAKAFLEHKVSI